LSTYYALVMAAVVFLFLIACDAIIQSSIIEIVTTTLLNFALFFYSIVQWYQAKHITSSQDTDVQQLVDYFLMAAEVAVIIFMGCACAAWCYLTYRLYYVFGWSQFKELGADVGMRAQLKIYHIYMMLLKVDVFFSLGFSIQYIFLVTRGPFATPTGHATTVHAGVAIPLNTALLVLGYLAVSREHNWLLVTFLVSLAACMGYMISKLVDIAQHAGTDTESPDGVSKYTGAEFSLTFFEVITLLLIATTFAVAVLNFRNFGKGL
ncbi:hypothetical protein CXG81DRAFT_4412, partial [Caulochytrium protostelioides]